MDRIGVVELNKNCGIYKITSPVGKVYIGQSSDIKNRFKVYQRLSCKQQVKLYNSLKKYGVENHQFDIIEYCSEEDLNCSERFWQDEFGGICKNTLNCLLQECGEERRTHGEESRRKMSQNSTSKGTRGLKKNSIKVIDIITKKEYSSIREAAFYNNIGIKQLAERLRGDINNDTNLIYLEDYLQGKTIIPKRNKTLVRVLDTKTGIIYESITEAAKANNLNNVTLGDYLLGRYENKTTLRRFEE